MDHVYIIQDINLIAQLQNKTVVVETDNSEKIEEIYNIVREHNQLYCIKLNVNQDISSISFKEEWKNIPLVIYRVSGSSTTLTNHVSGGRCGDLGWVRDLVSMLPILKKLNVKCFLDGAVAQNYEAVQILSSLGIYSGIVINENANWEKLTDLIYYALCNRVQHAPIEPFQYVYDAYKQHTLVDYGTVFFENQERFIYVDNFFTAKCAKETQSTQNINTLNPYLLKVPLVADCNKPWQRFFYEGSVCAACEGWRICMGKYADMEDKNSCRDFTVELLNVVENRKFKN